MTKICDLQANNTYSMKVLVASLEKKIATNNRPYFNILLQDDSGRISAKKWSVSKEDEELFIAGKVYNITFETSLYKNQLQAKIEKYEIVDNSEIDLNDYLEKPKVSKEYLKTIVFGAIEDIKNPVIRDVVSEILQKYEEDFFTYPAASSIHHACLSGLAIHVSEMIKIAKAIIGVFPHLKYDYLIAGVILHDVCKVKEYKSPVQASYTTLGKLIGHISLLDGEIAIIGERKNILDTEEINILRHLVLSHHGKLEYGSPVLPLTLEAEVLTFIDNLDAKVNTITTALTNINEGEFSDKVFSLENRTFYKI